MFLIGSPGREDGNLSLEAAQLLSFRGEATPALPGEVYTRSTEIGSAIRVVKVPVLIYKLSGARKRISSSEKDGGRICLGKNLGLYEEFLR
jgi:hypothetical protein